MWKRTCPAITAAFFGLIFLTPGRMPIFTRWIRADLLEILFGTASGTFYQKDCFLLEFYLRRILFHCFSSATSNAGEGERAVSRSFFAFSTLAFVVAEAASFSFGALASCFPLIAVSLLSLTASGFPFASASRQCACDGSFFTGFKISIPSLLIQELLRHGFQFRRKSFCSMFSIPRVLKEPIALWPRYLLGFFPHILERESAN